MLSIFRTRVPFKHFGSRQQTVLRYIPDQSPDKTVTAMISNISTETRVASGVVYDQKGSQEFKDVSISRVAVNMRKTAGQGPGKFVSAIPGLECSAFTRLLESTLYDPLSDNISSVTQVPTIQDDLTITNAARVSFHKEADTFSRISDNKRSDEGLLRYLVQHSHWTPVAQVNFLVGKALPKDLYIKYTEKANKYQMSHVILNISETSVSFLERGSAHAYFSMGTVPKGVYELLPYTTQAYYERRGCVVFVDNDASLFNSTFLGDNDHYQKLADSSTAINHNTAKLFTVTMRIKMPVSVARQYFKSGIGFVVNEVSRRYVRDPPEVYVPKEYREYTNDKKQGSKDTLVPCNEIAYLVTKRVTESSVAGYSTLLDSYSVCPEQSRGVLPQNMYTEFIQTGTVDAYIRMLRLRLANDAQWEIRMYAKAILKALRESEHRSFFEEFTSDFYPCIQE